jgi:opacity protein-like surface antigen
MLFLLSLRLCGAAERDAANGSPEASLPEDLFHSGRYEAAFINGVFFSPFGPTHNRPTINYTYTGLQLGYMLGDVKGDGWRRGNFEVAGEAFGSAILDGAGTYISGGTLWLRYNIVPRGFSALVPFAQAGAGMVSTDIDHDVVGEPFNFNLDLSLGVRYFVGRNWSINLEYRYQHISNADLGRHNLGINADGPFLGVSYFF